jgi:gamma-glutamylcyclotransferase (GGCT)/AIG2-like uncharacterized protein YtfP
MHEHDLIQCVFVYGTLKRGQCRERCWPRRPLEIESAWTLGRLFDLGPYPALVEGADRTLGELWRLAAADLRETLSALDRIEGYRGQPGDLYQRVVADCTTEAGDVVRAFTYRYSRPLPACAVPILPDTNGFCVWTGGM